MDEAFQEFAGKQGLSESEKGVAEVAWNAANERIQAFVQFVTAAPVGSDICCCGDSMAGHASPMHCGHVPVDQWHHSLSLWLKELGNRPPSMTSAERIARVKPPEPKQPVRWLADGTPVGDVSDEQLVAVLSDAKHKIEARNNWHDAPEGFVLVQATDAECLVRDAERYLDGGRSAGGRLAAKRVRALLAARPQVVEDRPPTDGCTESNCERCRTHPDHRGAMEHAGIGWRPGSPQEHSR